MTILGHSTDGNATSRLPVPCLLRVAARPAEDADVALSMTLLAGTTSCMC